MMLLVSSHVHQYLSQQSWTCVYLDGLSFTHWLQNMFSNLTRNGIPINVKLSNPDNVCGTKAKPVNSPRHMGPTSLSFQLQIQHVRFLPSQKVFLIFRACWHQAVMSRRQVRVQEKQGLVWDMSTQTLCSLLQIHNRLARFLMCLVWYQFQLLQKATGCNCQISARNLKNAICIGLHRRRNQSSI